MSQVPLAIAPELRTEHKPNAPAALATHEKRYIPDHGRILCDRNFADSLDMQCQTIEQRNSAPTAFVVLRFA
jgi:hypothetical protein